MNKLFVVLLSIVTLTSLSVEAGSDCSIYLAKSSIKKAGWGVFVAKDYEEGDTIVSPSLAIPLIDSGSDTSITGSSEMLSEYVWNSASVGGTMDGDFFLPGLASLINYHAILENVVLGGANGAKGSTFTLMAKRNIKAGEELFFEPGIKLQNPSHWTFDMPNADHYKRVDQIVAQLMQLITEGGDDAKKNSAMWTDILYRLKNDVMVAEDEDEQVRNLMPRNLNELEYANAHGIARLHTIERTLDWIEANGKCLDNIEVSESTISNAGKGAFSTRGISKGSLISPAPLVQVMNKDKFELDGAGVSAQRLLNHCFGHRKSPIALCPTTNVAMINHGSEKSANAELRWVKSSFLLGTLKELERAQKKLDTLTTQLMLEVVATREIQPGEEILLDFGKEWENKYNNHATNDKDSFRHYIPLPESIFPLKWRDDYKLGRSWALGSGKKSHKDARDKATREADYENALRQVTCGTYFAESNIEDSGFGMYTAVDIPAEVVVSNSKYPVVPFARNTSLQVRMMLDQYAWDGNSFVSDLILQTYSGLRSDIFLADIGSIANSHNSLENVAVKAPLAEFDPVLDRRTDPGAGASSNYVRAGFESRRPISAGQELFDDYGDVWFENRPQYQNIPLKRDFGNANTVVSSFWSTTVLDGAAVDEGNIERLMKFTKETIVSDPRAKIALEYFPTMNELRLAMEKNGTAETTVEARTPEWLEENGYCLDNIYVKRSSIEQAGNGAFSRRFLREGSTIISSPVILFEREFLSMNVSESTLPIQSKQLMLNYNFGHKDSSLMFLPSTQAIAINHNSNRNPYGSEPNAKIQWSTRDPSTQRTLSLPLDEVKQEIYSPMIMDVVATRDIAPDEEVFIDYGIEWEQAWNQHVENWEDPCYGRSHKDCFKSSKAVKELNHDKENTENFAWSDDHVTMCKMPKKSVGQNLEEIVFLKNPQNNTEHSHERAFKNWKGITFDHDGFTMTDYDMGPERFRACQIVNYDRKTKEYDVGVFLSEMMDVDRAENIFWRVIYITTLPIDNVKFVNKPLTDDMMVPTAFRHEIAIPDEMFPPVWKDLLNSNNENEHQKSMMVDASGNVADL